MSVLVDIASYVPSGRLDNLPSCERFAIQPQFLDEKIGTRKVARLEDGEDSSTMATAALQRLLEKTGLALSKISCVVVCTQNPAGKGIPHTSARVHHQMQMSDAVACFDISLGCSGYVYGLSAMAGFLEFNDLDNGVLITADPYSPILDPDDKNTVLLFGDAATASLIQRGESGGWELGRFLFATRGAAGEAIRNDTGLFEMKGREVFEFCLREVPLQIKALLQQSGLNADDVDAFVLHQGSRFIVEQVARALGLPSAKVPLFLEGIGNTVSSSIPLVLEHKVFPESCRRILLSGFGVGLSWASGLLERKI
jgi:3-oxoacyl-[acyl-carrier-protein] synthase III